jgi:hypothetical protein
MRNSSQLISQKYFFNNILIFIGHNIKIEAKFNALN